MTRSSDRTNLKALALGLEQQLLRDDLSPRERKRLLALLRQVQARLARLTISKLSGGSGGRWRATRSHRAGKDKAKATKKSAAQRLKARKGAKKTAAKKAFAKKAVAKKRLPGLLRIGLIMPPPAIPLRRTPHM